ncbi:MAG: hypothetical protein R8K46_02730 [Mariprofundaceae bacterium]
MNKCFNTYHYWQMGAGFLFLVMASSPAYAWDPSKDLNKTQSFISDINQACDDDFGTMKQTLSASSCSGCHTSPPSLNSAADMFKSFKDVSGYCTIASNTGGGGAGGGGMTDPGYEDGMGDDRHGHGGDKDRGHGGDKDKGHGGDKDKGKKHGKKHG